jgi:hypothetical protein
MHPFVKTGVIITGVVIAITLSLLFTIGSDWWLVVLGGSAVIFRLIRAPGMSEITMTDFCQLVLYGLAAYAALWFIEQVLILLPLLFVLVTAGAAIKTKMERES